MCAESPFSEKSSARLILERSRGLGILTFDKVRKTADKCKIGKTEIKTTETAVILSKSGLPPKNDVKNFFMGRFPAPPARHGGRTAASVSGPVGAVPVRSS